MKKTNAFFSPQRVTKGLVVVCVTLCLLFLSSVTVLANTVNIFDAAHVLNASKVRSAGSKLAYPLDVYTVNNYAGSSQQFDQAVHSRITSPNLIVMGLNTAGRFYVGGGPDVPLSSSQYNDANRAFTNDYGSSRNLTSATVASINALHGMFSSSGLGGNGAVSPARGGGINPAIWCVALLAIAGLAFFAITRARSRAAHGLGGLSNRPATPYGRPYDPNVNQPYNNPSPENYQPGYGPGTRNQGMNPLAAGGMGAAAGGLLGYLFGKEQGEQRPPSSQGGQEYYGGGGIGGDRGAGGDFGSSGDRGAGGDFGNSDDRRGAGGDFGNSGGGAGGDFGSSGAGGDFGNSDDRGAGGNF